MFCWRTYYSSCCQFPVKITFISKLLAKWPRQSLVPSLDMPLPAIRLQLLGFSLTLNCANSFLFSASLSGSNSTSDYLFSSSSSVNSLRLSELTSFQCRAINDNSELGIFLQIRIFLDFEYLPDTSTCIPQLQMVPR